MPGLVRNPARAVRPPDISGPAALTLPRQLGVGDGDLADFARSAGKAQRPAQGEGFREREVLAKPCRTVHLDGPVDNPFDEARRRDLDRLATRPEQGVPIDFDTLAQEMGVRRSGSGSGCWRGFRV